jgi:hypothetical protein
MRILSKLNPANRPSRKTLILLAAAFVAIIAIPTIVYLAWFRPTDPAALANQRYNAYIAQTESAKTLLATDPAGAHRMLQQSVQAARANGTLPIRSFGPSATASEGESLLLNLNWKLPPSTVSPADRDEFETYFKTHYADQYILLRTLHEKSKPSGSS